MSFGALLFFGVLSLTSSSAVKETSLDELRIYTAHPGKLDDLQARFRDHTLRIFEKHGMKNIGYWVPVNNSENKLYYVLRHKDRESRNASFKAMSADPEWKKAVAESEKNGRLVSKFEAYYLTPTDFSPDVPLEQAQPERLFELRIYQATEGQLEALNDRFRQHTLKLFERHGMTNLWYWNLASDSPPYKKNNTLIYFLAHKDEAALKQSFDAFRQDDDWIKARKASEEKAGSSLTIPNGVKSIVLKPTDYSPIK